MRLSNGEVCLEWPLAQHVLTAGYYYSGGSLHAAIDFRAMEGTPVFAAEDGTVSMIHNWDGKRTEGDTNSYGNMVKLKHADYNGSTLETLYAHLNSISVKKGQAVKAGDLIGYSGNTGNSFGAHLHFEVRYAGSRRNPLVWLDNDFTTANSNVYTFGPGEHSVDKGTDCGGTTSGNNGNMTGVSTANEHKGIDVSRYQGTIDWAKVAKAGIKFAMLRVVSSNNNGVYIDPTFEQNYKGATENGIPVGAYFFTYAKTEAAQNEEIEMMLKAFKGKTFQYPVALDIEDTNTAAIGKDALTALVKRGLDIIDQKGYMPILYTYTNYKQNYLDMSKLSAYDLWLADTRSSYDGRGKSAIWQYGQEKIDGVTGDCDVNYCYKNYNCDSQTPVDPEPEKPVEPPKPTDPDESNQKAIVFKKGSWNVRTGPGTEYSSVGVITSPDPKTGKDVVIGYESVVNGWYKTIYGYVGPSAVDTNKKPQKAIVFKQGTWNVRTGPGMNYGVVGTISSPDAKTGKAVTIGYEKINNGWFKTMYGYVGPSAVASYT